MKDRAEKRAELEQQFCAYPSLRPFLQHKDPPYDAIVELLINYVHDDNTNLHCVTAGKSGAVVFLMTDDAFLPRVVKIGEIGLIQLERENYNSHIKDKFPPTIVPLMLDATLQQHEAWASISYTWAGGTDPIEQLSTLAMRADVIAAKVSLALAELMQRVFRVYGSIRQTSDSPSRQWSWHDKADERIRDVLRKHSSQAANRLLEILDEQAPYLSKLAVKSFTASPVCHGDINYNNLVLCGTESHQVASLIDFGSVQLRKSPAYDWAKVGRDLQFKSTHDLCVLHNLPYAKILGILDKCNGAPQTSGSVLRALSTTNSRSILGNIFEWIRAIEAGHNRYSQATEDVREVEYLWFLLYWSLAYLDPRHYSHTPEEVDALISSIATTRDRLEQAAQAALRRDIPSEVVASTAPSQVADMLHTRARRAGTRLLSRVLWVVAIVVLSPVVIFLKSDGDHSNNVEHAVAKAETNIGTPLKLSARTKVLVLEFNVQNHQQYQIGSLLATSLRNVAHEIENDVTIEDSTQVIDVAADSGTDKALQIGRQQGAAAVIWGFATTTSEASLYAEFVPIPDNSSMQGSMGTILPIPLHILGTRQATVGLAANMATLVRVAVGLHRLNGADFGGFQKAMDDAIRENPVRNPFVDPADLYFLRGLAREVNLNRNSALNDYQRALQLNQDVSFDAKVWASMAQLYEEYGDYDLALSLCKRVVAGPNIAAPVLSACGQISYEVGDSTGTTAFASKILTVPRPSAEELKQRTALHVAFCQLDQAQLDIEYAKRHGYGDALLSNSDYVTLRLYSNGGADSPPDNANDFQLLVYEAKYSQLGDFALSIKAADRLIESMPSALAYSIRGFDKLSSGDSAGAISDLTDAIMLSPESQYLYLTRAEARRRGALREIDGSNARTSGIALALSDLQRADHLDPTNAQTQLAMALTLAGLEKGPEAVEHLKRAIRLQPTYARAYYVLGKLDEDMNNPASYDDYTRAINIVKQNLAPYAYPLAHPGGVCSSKGPPGRNAELSQYYWQRAEIRLDDTESGNGKSDSEVQSDINAAFQLDPNEGRRSFLNSMLAEAAPDFLRAEAEARKAILYDPDNAKYYAHLGDVLDTIYMSDEPMTEADTRRHDEAIRAYDKAISLDPLNTDYRAGRVRASATRLALIQ